MVYHWLLVYSSRRDISLRRVCLLLNLGLVDVRISPGPKTRTFRWNLVTRPTRKDSLLGMSRVPPAILSTHPLFQNDVLRPPFLAPLLAVSLLPELLYAASASGVKSPVGSLTPMLHACSLFNGRHRHPSFFFLSPELGARYQVSVPPLGQDFLFRNPAICRRLRPLDASAHHSSMMATTLTKNTNQAVWKMTPTNALGIDTTSLNARPLVAHRFSQIQDISQQIL